jgi:hypothetical protein
VTADEVVRATVIAVVVVVCLFQEIVCTAVIAIAIAALVEVVCTAIVADAPSQVVGTAIIAIATMAEVVCTAIIAVITLAA